MGSAAVCGLALAIVVAVVLQHGPESNVSPVETRQDTPAVALDDSPTDQELQQAVDDLIVFADPDLLENRHFNTFVTEKLRWMSDEFAAGRLTIALLTDIDPRIIPSDVMMAATHVNDRPTIVVAKPMFARFLAEGGRTRSPFTRQQRNDFTVVLVHEVVHLQRWSDKPFSQASRIREESDVWRQITLQVVRPWRALSEPLHRRFIQVDEAFRSCGDTLPCGPIGRLVTP